MSQRTQGAESQAAATNGGFVAVGHRPIRHDGVDKVTGKAMYGADISLPGMLYGAMLRSPHAHARIISIDTSRAEANPDVKAVATSADLALGSEKLAEVGEGVVTSTRYMSNNVLAADKVLYKGHAVAAVAASNPHVAEEALALIDVTYEVLPAVTTAEEAMKPDAPILHDHLVAPSYGDEPPAKSNIAEHQQFKLGGVEQGFEEAELVLEREFRTKSVHQGYIEPQNGTAWWTQDGHLTIWCSSQGHFGIRDNTAKVLGLDVSSVTVVPMEIGGGFGGKLPTYLEPVAAVLSKKSGRPVKMTMNRAEVLEATGPTSGTHIRLKMGVTREGRITAARPTWHTRPAPTPARPSAGRWRACSARTASRTSSWTATTWSRTSRRPRRTGRRARPWAPSLSRLLWMRCARRFSSIRWRSDNSTGRGRGPAAWTASSTLASDSWRWWRP